MRNAGSTIGIGQDNPTCQIELIGVTCGRASNVPAVQELARRNGFCDLTIDVR